MASVLLNSAGYHTGITSPETDTWRDAVDELVGQSQRPESCAQGAVRRLPL